MGEIDNLIYFLLSANLGGKGFLGQGSDKHLRLQHLLSLTHVFGVSTNDKRRKKPRKRSTTSLNVQSQNNAGRKRRCNRMRSGYRLDLRLLKDSEGQRP
jgi:hypothetical protein